MEFLFFLRISGCFNKSQGFPLLVVQLISARCMRGTEFEDAELEYWAYVDTTSR